METPGRPAALPRPLPKSPRARTRKPEIIPYQCAPADRGSANLPYGAQLVDSLPLLGVTEQELRGAREWALSRLADADPWDVRNLVDVLCALKPTSDERREARAHVVNILSESICSRADTARTVAGALPALATTKSEQRKLRPPVLTNLISSTLTQLTNTAERDIRTPHFPNADIRAVAGVLQILEPSEKERSKACRAILAALQNAVNLDSVSTWDIARLMPTLHGLGLSRKERVQTRHIMLAALSDIRPLGSSRSLSSSYRQVAHELHALSPTQQELRTVREHMLRVWPNSDPADAEQLVATFLTLEPTPEEQAAARRQILLLLSTSEVHVREQLVGALLPLEPTSDDRAAARKHMLTVIRDAAPAALPFLVDQWTTLIQTERESSEARDLVLATLRNDHAYQVASPGHVERLVNMLLALEPTEEERAEARRQVLTALAHAEERDATRLTSTLSALARTEFEQDATTQQLQACMKSTFGGKRRNLRRALRLWRGRDS